MISVFQVRSSPFFVCLIKKSKSYLCTVMGMKKFAVISILLLFAVLFVAVDAAGQCSICTKTASQLGEKPAAALNTAILYLMGAPFLIIGFVGWRWWKAQKEEEKA